jgi:hypothetical protein
MRDVSSIASGIGAAAVNTLLDRILISPISTLFTGNDLHITGNDFLQAEFAARDFASDIELRVGNALGGRIIGNWLYDSGLFR